MTKKKIIFFGVQLGFSKNQKFFKGAQLDRGYKIEYDNFTKSFIIINLFFFSKFLFFKKN